MTRRLYVEDEIAGDPPVDPPAPVTPEVPQAQIAGEITLETIIAQIANVQAMKRERQRLRDEHSRLFRSSIPREQDRYQALPGIIRDHRHLLEEAQEQLYDMLTQALGMEMMDMSNLIGTTD